MAVDSKLDIGAVRRGQSPSTTNSSALDVGAVQEAIPPAGTAITWRLKADPQSPLGSVWELSAA